jgi:TatD DNase family protein
VPPDAIETIQALACRPEVVAIGECGLDFNRNYTPKDIQRVCFEQQLDLAIELNMPVFIHERDAHDMMGEVLFPRLAQLPGAVIHCFTGNEEQLDDYVAQGLYIGITGWICDERRGQELQKIVSRIPLNRILIETDAPFLLPRDLEPMPKSRRNEPKYLPHIMNTVARCMGVEAPDLAKATSENAAALFSLEESHG